ncbi:MAG: 4'-phosphopantetheinyl transferase superfamily protein [Candidatus Sulfotelmatobacter sp.]
MIDMNIARSGFEIASALELPDNEVHLWRIDFDAVRSEEARWQRTLSPDETARASRFHFAVDRQRYAISRGVLRTIVAGYLATDAKNLDFVYSGKEKPSLSATYSREGLMFNISHSGSVGLLAFTREREIGVDVEQVRSDFEVDAIARRFFSAHEQEQLAVLPEQERFEAFFRCWTRKEAYIKATGDGLSLPLDQFDVSIVSGHSDALIATRPDKSEAARWLLREVPAGHGYLAALCAQGHDWKLKDWKDTSDS